MPVPTDSSRSDYDRQTSIAVPRHAASLPHADQSNEWITIGLINNMPDAAFKATERQFESLLETASEGMKVRLSLYLLPEIPRKELSAHQASEYSSVEALWGTQLDGLIVTGREPLTQNLRDECYWGSFTKVLEWAKDNTHSTIWSCLAAHGAILQMDGVSRRRNGKKHFGVLDCTRVSDHRLNANTPSRFQVPHSRYNGVDEEELAACGYSVLARTADAGVDSFVKEVNSLFVFLQGHPEYESDTLLREYRRDVERYFKHEASTYPSLPQGYFDTPTEEVLTALGEMALSSRSQELMASVALALSGKSIDETWRRPAVSLYRNWLGYLSARKHAAECDSQAILV